MKYNNTVLTKVIYNGVTVWTGITYQSSFYGRGSNTGMYYHSYALITTPHMREGLSVRMTAWKSEGHGIPQGINMWANNTCIASAAGTGAPAGEGINAYTTTKKGINTFWAGWESDNSYAVDYEVSID